MKHDILFINQLGVDAIIGVLPHERIRKQKIFFDLQFSIDVRKVAADDSLKNAIDYARLSKALVNFVNDTQYQLVETLAEKTAEFLLQEFKLTWLKLHLYKPAALANAETVGVVIERP